MAGRADRACRSVGPQRPRDRACDRQIGAGTDGTATAACPAGKKAIGGGHWIKQGDVKILRNYEASPGTWQVYAYNQSPLMLPASVDVYAYCAFVA